MIIMMKIKTMLFSSDSFSNLENKSFKLTFTDGKTLSAELIEVKESSHSFSLLFKVSTPVIYEQGVYTLENDKTGVLSLFIVPLASDEKSVTYEAVIS